MYITVFWYILNEQFLNEPLCCCQKWVICIAKIIFDTNLLFLVATNADNFLNKTQWIVRD